MRWWRETCVDFQPLLVSKDHILVVDDVFLYSTSSRKRYRNTKPWLFLHSLERCLTYKFFMDVEITMMPKMAKWCCHCARALATILMVSQYRDMRKKDRLPAKTKTSHSRNTRTFNSDGDGVHFGRFGEHLTLLRVGATRAVRQEVVRENRIPIPYRKCEAVEHHGCLCMHTIHRCNMRWATKIRETL